MCCEKLSLHGFINEVKDVNVGPHPRKFCFILGAGASRSSGIKSGQELVNMWDKEISERNNEDYIKWKKELSITDENKYSHYSHYYEKRFSKHPSDGYNYLEKIMEKAKPSIGYVLLSYLLTQTSNNVVITTNFDHLIEDAVNYYTQTMPLVIGHESLAHYVTTQITRPTIIKIHRDLLFDPASSSEEVEVLHENWVEALEKIFQNYNPVFIGYAGNDNSLMNFLISSRQKFSNNTFCSPYWMLYSKDIIKGKVKDFLDHSNSYYISHNGFDETIYQLTAALDIKFPTKDVLVGEAEQRYQKIADSIDRFTQMIYESDADKESYFKNENEELKNINKAVLKITSQTEAQNKFREAVTSISNGHYYKALDISNELINNYPTNARYYSLKSDVLGVLCNYEDAIKFCKMAIEIAPEDDSYYVDLANLYKRMGDYDKAIEAYHKAIEIAPENDSYYAVIANLYEKIEDYDKAIETYYKAIEIAPKDDSYYAVIANLYEKMEDYDKAIETYHKAIEIAPENDSYYVVLANLYKRMGDYDKAIEVYQKAIELDPNNAQYRNSKGITLCKIGRYKEALLEHDEAIRLDSNNAQYRNSKGITLCKIGHYEEALLEHDEAIRLDPNNAQYRNSKGITLCKIGRCKEALLEHDEAIRLDPNNAQYRNSKGITLRKMKCYEKALLEHNEAISLDHNNAKYHNNKGITLYKMKDYEEALNEFSKAIIIDRDNAQYYHYVISAKIKYDDYIKKQK